MLTLNQIQRRIKTISLSHKQVRSFRKGLVSDLFADKTAKYPACCLQYTNGNISVSGNAATINLRMHVLDMVHVSEDTKENEDDVLSDTLSIIQDLIAQMSNPNYDDWAFSSTGNIQAEEEKENDMIAGWYVDFSIRFMFQQNVCQIPTELTDFTTTDTDMRLVYDINYTAMGSEGTVLAIPALAGKMLLLVVRANKPIHKVSNLPDTDQFTWNGTSIGLGSATALDERFLILYRNY